MFDHETIARPSDGAHAGRARPWDGDTTRAVEALYTVGHWLVGASRHRDAAGIFRLMALTQPADERGWLGLGACHESLGQAELALAMYGTGRAMAPAGARIEIARARLLDALGRHDEAASAWDAAREKAEDDASLRDAFAITEVAP